MRGVREVSERVVLVGDSMTREVLEVCSGTTVIEVLTRRRTNSTQNPPVLERGWLGGVRGWGSRPDGAKRGAGAGADGEVGRV